MVSIRLFRKKIKSAKNIAKITRAMQMVAASKMKRAQDIALSGREYSIGIDELSIMLSSVKLTHPLFGSELQIGDDVSKRILVVLIAPEKGLCGSLVTNLYKKLLQYLSEYSKENIDFVCIGKKAIDIAKKTGVNIIADFSFGFSYPKYEFVTPVAGLIKEKFISGQVDRVDVVYADFINTMTQIPNVKTLLPVKRQTETGSSGNFVLFEPNEQSILEPLINMYTEIQLFQLFLESYASEQSSRMVSMKSATDNANGLIGQLTVDYNKARQMSITNEILDISNAGEILAHE